MNRFWIALLIIFMISKAVHAANYYSNPVGSVLTGNSNTTLDLESNTLNLSGSDTPLINNGSFETGTSTINFSNVSSVNIPALNYYNFNLIWGPRILADSGIIGIASEFITGGGGFTVTGSTVNFNGSEAQTIPAFTFNNVILSGSGVKEIEGATEVNVNSIEIQDGPSLDILNDGQLNITN